MDEEAKVYLVVRFLGFFLLFVFLVIFIDNKTKGFLPYKSTDIVSAKIVDYTLYGDTDYNLAQSFIISYTYNDLEYSIRSHKALTHGHREEAKVGNKIQVYINKDNPALVSSIYYKKIIDLRLMVTLIGGIILVLLSFVWNKLKKWVEK